MVKYDLLSATKTIGHKFAGVNVVIDAQMHIYPDLVAKETIHTVISNTKGRLNAHIAETFNGPKDSIYAAGGDFLIILPVAANLGNGILAWIN